MEQSRQNYLSWLQDAHAMEKQALAMMEAQLSGLSGYPHLRNRMESHIAETREQLTALSRLLSRQGSDASVAKSTLGKVAAFGKSLSGVFSGDGAVKGTLASYTFEQMEIASYRILITAAEQLGDREAVAVFTQSLEQEEDMATWLAGHTAEITRQFLSRSDVAELASR